MDVSPSGFSITDPIPYRLTALGVQAGSWGTRTFDAPTDPDSLALKLAVESERGSRHSQDIGRRRSPGQTVHYCLTGFCRFAYCGIEIRGSGLHRLASIRYDEVTCVACMQAAA